MADIGNHIHLRDKRDRLIDLLKFGETHPLRDVPVEMEQLVVPQNTPAAIPIDGAQEDCNYDLWEREQGTLVPGAALKGNGVRLLLMSPNIAAPIAYRIRAKRVGNTREVYLKEVAEIKTGFNAALHARITNGELLDRNIENPSPQDPRVVDYNANVIVTVDYSQNGVLYRLVRVKADNTLEILSPDVPGTFGTITLITKPLIESAKLRICVIRTSNINEQTLLDIMLPVEVRPNVDCAVSVEGTHILNYEQAANIAITNTQPDVTYRLYAKPLRAGDFLRDPATGGISVAVPGEGQDVFNIKRPAHDAVWTLLPDFVLRGAATTGNGAVRSIPAGTFKEDTLIQVRAERPTSGSGTATLSSPLRQVAVALVRPNPAPSLCVQVFKGDDTTSGAVRMTGGQPGVAYQLRPTANGANLGTTGYFYEREGTNPEKNVGIGLLTMGRDFVVGRDPQTDIVIPEFQGIESLAVEVDLAISEASTDFDRLTDAQRAALVPEMPIVQTGPLPMTATLYGVAIKARTALKANLTFFATLKPVPAVVAQIDGLGGPVNAVVVKASQVGEKYSLRVNGFAEGSAKDGNGADITMTITKSIADPILEVTVRRAPASAIPVETIVRVVDTIVQVAAI